ncbi:MAG: hypothetical protein ACREQD_12395, partial [Candidatus Binataceae bacterium]
NVGEAWLGFLGRQYAAWRYAEYGLFMALCYAQREALSDVVATPFLFQAVDKERHAQDIALHCMALEEQVKGFSDAGAMDIWMGDPALQPTRRFVEYLLACRDWAEIIFAVNLAFEPLVGRLLGNYLIAQQACACGDPVTPLIAETVETDRQRAIASTAELARFVIANDPGNHTVIQEWLDHWTPQATAAAEALGALAKYPHDDPARFRTMLQRLQAEQTDLIASIGLTQSRVSA